jgi:hypothetical protein
MSNLEVKFDNEELFRSFNDLEKAVQGKIMKVALRAGAGVLARETRTNIKATFPNTITTYKGRSRDMLDGVTVNSKESADGVSVSILNHPLLRILEKGTYKTGIRYVGTYAGRKLRKRASRGSVRAYNFFSHAQSQSNEKAGNLIDKVFGEMIDKEME